jgi:hypothetical protein
MEHYYTMNEFPQTVEKKVKLLHYFRNYMKEHLLKAGANIEVFLFRLFLSSGILLKIIVFSPNAIFQ